MPPRASDPEGATAPAPTAELDALAVRLEASGAYRVLRRLQPAPRIDRASLPPGAREAIVLDLETTGLDPDADVAIEIAMVRFAYDADGRILGVTAELVALEDPKRPLPLEVARLTGLSDADLVGRAFPDPRVVEMLDGAVLVVAHNAAFDRPFAEMRWPAFTKLAWACSLRDVPWRDVEGFESGGLKALLVEHGLFFAGHRALEDVEAVVELLGRRLPSDEERVLNRLRRNAAVATVRLWAKDAPFDKKDLLKGRGYRWNPKARSWWTDVPEATLDEELVYLQTEVYPKGDMPPLPTAKIDAWNRYSRRVAEEPPR